MLNTKKILFIVLILLVSVTLFYFLVKPTAPTSVQQPKESIDIEIFNSNGNFCDNLYKEIKDEISKANYCIEDSDCIPLILGGSYIDFGCYHYVNKSADQSKIWEYLKSYVESCVGPINDCAPVSESVCVSNICVATQ